jgi:Phosphatidylinositol-specific phospholipase C, X domain
MAGNIVKYTLLLGITALCVYIIYRMIKDREANNPQRNKLVLPYSNTSTTAQLNELYSIEDTRTGSGLKTFGGGSDGSPTNLRDYCIKASYNSAFTGKYVCLDMVKYVLQRGCRFLDFSVFIKDSIPIVAYSNSLYDPSYTSFTSLEPSLSLAGVFSTIMSNAFSNTSPNPGDPLFIQLHINTYLQDGYEDVAKVIAGGLGDKLYQGSNGKASTVSMDTQITDLMGKIVIIIDGTASQGFQNYTSCSPNNDAGCINLKDYANMISGQNTIRLYTEDQLTRQSINPPDPSVYLLRIVLPVPGVFYGTLNPDAFYLIPNYGAQIITQAFYYNDSKLRNYEAMFRTYQSAFIPLSTALAYIQGQT